MELKVVMIPCKILTSRAVRKSYPATAQISLRNQVSDQSICRQADSSMDSKLSIGQKASALLSTGGRIIPKSQFPV